MTTMMGRVMLVRADEALKSRLCDLGPTVGLDRNIIEAVWRGRLAIGDKIMTFDEFEEIMLDFFRIGAHVVWRPEGPAEPLDEKHEEEMWALREAESAAALTTNLPSWTIAQLTEERRRITAGLETLGRLASQPELMAKLVPGETDERGSARIIGAASALAELDSVVARELVARAKKVIAR